MKHKFLLIILFSFIFSKSFSQNDSSNTIFSIPDSIANKSIDYDENLNDLFAYETQIQTQKLLKNLFLIGFIFMTIIVIFLFYINNTKIKQVVRLVKKQEYDIVLKKFEVEKLSIILNNTVDAIVIIDDINNILWNNQSFYELYEISKEEVINKNIDFFSNEDNKIQELLDKTKIEKKPIQYTFSFKSKNDRIIYIQRRILPITDSKSEIKNFAIIDTDYTALKIAFDKQNS